MWEGDILWHVICSAGGLPVGDVLQEESAVSAVSRPGVAVPSDSSGIALYCSGKKWKSGEDVVASAAGFSMSRHRVDRAGADADGQSIRVSLCRAFIGRFWTGGDRGCEPRSRPQHSQGPSVSLGMQSSIGRPKFRRRSLLLIADTPH